MSISVSVSARLFACLLVCLFVCELQCVSVCTIHSYFEPCRLKTMRELLQTRGYALDDFLQLMHHRLVLQPMPVAQRVRLTVALADVDFRLKLGCGDQVTHECPLLTHNP